MRVYRWWPWAGLLLSAICFAIGAVSLINAVEIERAELDNPGAGASIICLPQADDTQKSKGANGFAVRDDIPIDGELQVALWAACEEYGIEYALALGLIEVESAFQTDAVSPAGCYGLMQLNPKYFPPNLSPEDNILYGIDFLAEKISQYGGDLEAALTAYNAGHDTGAREYAEKVMAAAERWRTI